MCGCNDEGWCEGMRCSRGHSLGACPESGADPDCPKCLSLEYELEAMYEEGKFARHEDEADMTLVGPIACVRCDRLFGVDAHCLHESMGIVSCPYCTERQLVRS